MYLLDALAQTATPTLAAAGATSADGSSLDLFQIAGLLLVITALLAWINERLLKLPATIGVMVLAMVLSLTLLGVSVLAPPGSALDRLDMTAVQILAAIDFEFLVLNVMLAFLLFAGALHVDLNDLSAQKWIIATLATLGVVVSTFAVGTAAYYIVPLLGFELRYIEALLFGALITPTDPIAVLGLMKRAGVPKTLETKVIGESLFNDGIGVVVFLTLLGIAYPNAGHGGHDETASHETAAAMVDDINDAAGHDAAVLTPGESDAVGAADSDNGVLDVAQLFAWEVGGGIVVGLIAGLVAYWFTKRVDEYSVEILITLGLAVGAYALCTYLHMAGPLAVVVGGLLMGNKGRLTGMSDRTREHLDTFWQLIDEILNAVLFVLIGLELLVIFGAAETPPTGKLLAGLAMIPAVLLARSIAVTGGVGLLKLTSLRTEFTTGARRVLVWAGLRGGISVALALALPADAPARSLILGMTYVVVAFSIIVQGLTVPAVVKWAVPGAGTKTSDEATTH